MLERYHIKQQISHKAGRTTYLADDSETNEQVIIKILEFNELLTWEDFKLFEREAKTLKNLNYPQIPKYLDYFEVESEGRRGFALVQSYIKASSLAEIIERGASFSEAEIVELAEKILNILNYLHNLNPPIIHRDIKPSNILLSNRSGNSIGDIYLVDFGSIQTTVKKEAGSITIVGSYGYIPLEQFMGKTTFASDLYSLGMTLIYLVTGIHPADLTQVKGKVRFNNNNVSRHFTNWLEKITDPYVDNRYQSAAIALKALQTKNNSSDLQHLKPQHSQINLYRDYDKLIITYPLVGVKNSNVFGWLILLLLLCFPLLALAASSLLLIIVISGLVVSTKKILSNTLSSSYGLVIMTKNKDNNISTRIGSYFQSSTEPNLIESLQTQADSNLSDNLVKTVKKINWNSSCIEEKISLIVYNPSYSFDKCLDSQRNLINGRNITVSPKLSINGTGSPNRRDIFQNSKLSDDELWWVGQEISEFLDLELQVVYSTPIVPPQPQA